MPLHNSQHFYGWGPYPNPRGFVTSDAMELFVKGTFVRRNIKRDVVKSAVRPYDDCNCSIRDRTLKLIRENHKLVIPMYELDKRGAFEATAPEAIALVSSQLALSAEAVRDMVIDAWRASFDMRVGDPPISMRAILLGTHILRRDDFHYD